MTIVRSCLSPQHILLCIQLQRQIWGADDLSSWRPSFVAAQGTGNQAYLAFHNWGVQHYPSRAARGHLAGGVASPPGREAK